MAWFEIGIQKECEEEIVDEEGGGGFRTLIKVVKCNQDPMNYIRC